MTTVDPAHPDVSESIIVARPADVVWAAVSDPRRLVGWSPEATEVRSDVTGPMPVGAVFAGSNRNGRKSWSTSCRVVESTVGVAFAFDVSYLGLAVARWRYRLDDAPEGCRVEEQWWDRRGLLMRAISGVGTGVRDRVTHNRESMRVTLRALKADLESPS